MKEKAQAIRKHPFDNDRCTNSNVQPHNRLGLYTALA
jgi:hypothetical protein